MNFMTGIAMAKEGDEDFVVSAVTWFTTTPPTFVTRGFTLPYIKENLLSVVIVNNITRTKTVNAACHRTIEKLLMKKWLHPGKPLGIELLVKPALSKEHFILPCKKIKSHWLYNAAEVALMTWLRGER